MELLDITRIVIAALYLAMAFVSMFVFFTVSVFAHKLAASAGFIVSILWGAFYLTLSFFSPLDVDAVHVASLASRVIHLPTLAALGVVLFTVWKQSQTLYVVKEKIESEEAL